MTKVHPLRPLDSESESNSDFDHHVPYSDVTSLVLKAHLLIERALLKFIATRVSSDLYDEIAGKEFSYFQRVILARALAHHDAQPIEGDKEIWPSLKRIGKLRNDLVHKLSHSGTTIEDQLRVFVDTMDPDRSIWGTIYAKQNPHWVFQQAAIRLHFLLTLSKEPLTLSDIDFDSAED